MKIGILTDSTADLSDEIMSEYEIEYIPLFVNFGEEVYKDREEISAAGFFKKLKSHEEIPHTSKPSIGLFIEKYQQMLKKYDHIISIHLSAALSSTIESAELAAREVDGNKITVFDSASISLGLGMLVVLTAEMIRAGKSLDYIINNLNKARENLFLYFTVKNLDYMEKGGRIGKASSLLGSIFNINPIISISTENGKVEPIRKVRGKHKAMQKLKEITLEKISEQNNVWLGFAHGDRLDDLEEFKSSLLNSIDDNKTNFRTFSSRISATLGSHVGPSVYAVIILRGNYQ